MHEGTEPEGTKEEGTVRETGKGIAVYLEGTERRMDKERVEVDHEADQGQIGTDREAGRRPEEGREEEGGVGEAHRRSDGGSGQLPIEHRRSQQGILRIEEEEGFDASGKERPLPEGDELAAIAERVEGRTGKSRSDAALDGGETHTQREGFGEEGPSDIQGERRSVEADRRFLLRIGHRELPVRRQHLHRRRGHGRKPALSSHRRIGQSRDSNFEGDEQEQVSRRGDVHASEPVARSAPGIPADEGRDRDGDQVGLRGEVRQSLEVHLREDPHLPEPGSGHPAGQDHRVGLRHFGRGSGLVERISDGRLLQQVQVEVGDPKDQIREERGDIRSRVGDEEVEGKAQRCRGGDQQDRVGDAKDGDEELQGQGRL